VPQVHGVARARRRTPLPQTRRRGMADGRGQECLLCPNEGGAFKQTVQGEWVHLLCALWVRETQVVNSTFMEPVAGVDAIPRTRWKLVRLIHPPSAAAR
jgi:hypothetical protein